MNKKLCIVLSIIMLTVNLSGCASYSLSRRVTNEIMGEITSDISDAVSEAIEMETSHVLLDIVSTVNSEDAYLQEERLDCINAWGETLFALEQERIIEFLSLIDVGEWTPCSFREQDWEDACYIVYSQTRSKTVFGTNNSRIDLFCITFYEDSCYAEIKINFGSFADKTYCYLLPEPLTDLLQFYM